ncbi:MAG TPA: thrombospondin type 3 repeat-containing protein, partial [Kofleriaceae bacterium]|nr:thrombospondin type 3 repeat-containing protein [Kofleriaceae bacterium]
VGALVHHRVGGALVASLLLWHRLQLGIEIPVVLYQFRNANFLGATQPLTALDKVGLGDIRLSPKFSLLRQAAHGVDLAVMPTFSLPSGGATNYFGDNGLTFLPEIAVSRHWGRAGKLRTLFNLGYRARKNTAAANLRVGDELGIRIGVGYPVAKLRNHRAVDLGVTWSAAMNAYNATNSTFNQVPMEASLGVTLPLSSLDVLVAGGLGLQSGFGSPDWRTVVGVRYHNVGKTAHVAAVEKPTPKVVDTDSDGLVDPVDQCTTEAEDIDGFEDTDGCPEADNDRDGVADQADKCPIETGSAENNGCPDTDGDQDGVVDRLDTCPTEAEDQDGSDDNDGCVDPDNDQDGVLDAADRCPVQAGVAENFGCPDQDQDNDGNVDRLDNCPTEAGTAKNSGCKDKQLVAVRNGVIEILEQVFFDSNKDTIQKRSNKLLDNVAKVMLAHNELNF